MAARSGQKIKLLHIIDILKHYTDEEHPLSANDICDKLATVGVTAERKAIYDDIECLIDFGYDIIKTRTPKNGYFLGERDFEIPEIYLLCDAVRTAKFISTKKSRELISKLDGMLSRHHNRNKGIYINAVAKTQNEEIFYNIDTIGRAIENKKRITLKYGVRTLLSGKEISIVYKERTVSPYAMTWQDDHYYLICNYDKYDNLLHLRIDRMRNVQETNVAVRPYNEVSQYGEVFDVADYTAKLFGMFGGETEDVELCCSKKILEQVADRFGEEIFITKLTDQTFSFTTKATVSQGLATWIMNYGSDIVVKKPEHLKDMILDRVDQIKKSYKNT